MPQELAVGLDIALALGIDVERASKVVITIEPQRLVEVVVHYHTSKDRQSKVIGLSSRYHLVGALADV